MPAPTPREPACTRCEHTWHLLPCDWCDCHDSAWHHYPDPETYPLIAT